MQKYIEQPLLVHRRKFDIRVWVLLCPDPRTGRLRGHLYEHGYLRTSSTRYTAANVSDRRAHLTNDAVQKNDEKYGMYEDANKLTFAQFQQYLDDARELLLGGGAVSRGDRRGAARRGGAG